MNDIRLSNYIDIDFATAHYITIYSNVFFAASVSGHSFLSFEDEARGLSGAAIEPGCDPHLDDDELGIAII